MKSLATDTIRAVYKKIDPKWHNHTFELFGYDFMIDEDFKVWLIEVNTNPCLELSSSHLARLIPNVVECALKLAIDPVFPPPEWNNSRKGLIPDISEVQKFELVFDEATTSAEIRNLPIHNENALNGIIHEEDEEEDLCSDDGCGVEVEEEEN